MAAGCSATWQSERADHVANRILERRTDDVLRNREAEARQPLPGPPPPEPPAPDAAEAEPPAEEPAPLVLDLKGALAVAYRSSRRMIDRTDTLQREALSLATVRHSFSPQLALALSYTLANAPGGIPDSEGGGADASLTQILPTGAQLRFDASGGATNVEGTPLVYDSTIVSVSLVQPLLRGGGYAVTHEPLIQAERNLVYALREFELFREDFSIDVARRYYDLVNRKQTIDNQKSNLESNEFARRSAEALFAVGRASELDVLRARRSELTARNALLEAQEGLELALDTFRIFLGLPEDSPVDVQGDSPVFTAVSYDVRSAVEVAHQNRLDLLNRVEQLEDVERNVKLARNLLLPALSLQFESAYLTAPSLDFGEGDFDRSGSSVAVALEIPIDRVRERNAYRSAELTYTRAQRDLEEFEDQLAVDIRGSFRELERRLESLDIQRQLIVDQTKNLRIAELRFERGDFENRDVVEANQSLLDAQNALSDEQVGYEIARLELLRDLGILFVDEEGMWKR